MVLKTYLKASKWSLNACNFIEKRYQHMSFPVSFAKLLGTSILKNICERLLLKVNSISWTISKQRFQRKVLAESGKLTLYFNFLCTREKKTKARGKKESLLFR